MPLCPQITNTPITVVQNSDFVVSSVVPVVPADTQDVAAVQSTAAAAAAAAAAASAIAATAVQTSANTIVNASNQLTAINGNGITVYAGASATSGARVVLNSSGLAGFNSSGSATLAISASTGTVEVTGGILSGGSITGTAINVPTVGSPVFSVNALGQMTASSANITGTITATAGTISGALTVTGSLTGGTIQTSSGGNAVVLSGADNALGIKYGGSYAGWLVGIGSGAFMMHYGTSPSVVGYPRVSVSSTTSSLAADGSNSLSITTSGNNVQGATAFGANLTAQSYLINSGIAIQNGTAVHILTGGRLVQSTSSERFKKNIVSIPEGGWLDKVTQIRPVNFQYDEAYSEAPDEVISGLIAEDIAEIPGFEHLIYNDPLGDPFSISYERLTIFLVLAIKELKAEINQLKGE